MDQVLSYRIFPLGDSAITIDFGNTIDEKTNSEVIARFEEFKKDPLPGMLELVPAYSSLTLYYDVSHLKKKVQAGQTVYEWMKQETEKRLQKLSVGIITEERLVEVPVCFQEEFGPDLPGMAAIKKMPVEELVQIFSSQIYKVYMLGFLPGFAYMGELDERISAPRKSQPIKIKAGSVGIAGRQTGIYPLDSPGGWQIIGRTPLKTVSLNPIDGADERDRLTLFKAGDRVKFIPITRDEFENY